MSKKIIDGEDFVKINERGQVYIHIKPKGNDLIVKKVRFIGKINKENVEIEMTINQFNEWLNKRFAKKGDSE